MKTKLFNNLVNSIKEMKDIRREGDKMSDIIKEGKEWLASMSDNLQDAERIIEPLITELEAAREVVDAAKELFYGEYAINDYKLKDSDALRGSVESYNKTRGGK